MPSAKLLAAAVLLTAVSCSNSLYAAVDMFLDFGSMIQGESTDKAHAGTVDVLAWNWGMANSGSTHVGSGAVTGMASFQDLSLTKYVDRSSPALLLRCATGEHIPEATLIVRKAGATPVEYIKIKLTEVLVSSVSTGGSGGEDRLTENVTLNFAEMSLTYTPDISNVPKDSLQFTWDIPNQNTGTNGGGTVLPPIPVTGLTSTLTYVNGAPLARLTWASIQGATSYQVWAASELGGPFQTYGNPTPSAGNGTTSVTVPADAIKKFFRIQTLPTQ